MKTVVHARLPAFAPTALWRVCRSSLVSFASGGGKGSRSFCLCLLLVVGLCACSSDQKPAPARPAATSQRTPIGQLPPIDTDALLAHTKVLSSDEYEGRAPGSKGETLSVTYIADQFKKVGLKPGNTDGTYFQKVPLVGITPTAAPLVFKRGTQ